MRYFYWIVTISFCALMIFSSVIYLYDFKGVASEFIKLGFPSWLIYPLALLKVAGVATILWYKNRSLVEWAYAGFSLTVVVALVSHIYAADGDYWAALIALILVLSSYFSSKKVRLL